MDMGVSTSTRRIAVVMEPWRHNAAQASEGIRAFACQRPDWVLSLHGMGGPGRASLPAWRPDGILTQAYTPVELDTVAALGCPVVDIGAAYRAKGLHWHLGDDRR